MITERVSSLIEFAFNKFESNNFRNFVTDTERFSNLVQNFNFEAHITNESDRHSRWDSFENGWEKLIKGNKVISIDIKHAEVIDRHFRIHLEVTWPHQNFFELGER